MVSPNDLPCCSTQKWWEAQVFKECMSAVNAPPHSSGFPTPSLPPSPQKLQILFVLWVWRRDNGPNSTPAQVEFDCLGYSCLRWICLSHSHNKKIRKKFVSVFFNLFIYFWNLFPNILPLRQGKCKAQARMKESLPDPPSGAHCHGQRFSRRTLPCCIFQSPTSTSSGCKLPGCKQGCMLLEHWREWEDENFVRLLWEESFSHLFLKQDLFLFVSSGIMCFSNHCFMLPWQIGLMPLLVCICSPDFPQAPFLLDSCSVFLSLLLSLGFSQPFLPDSHSVFYAIYTHTGQVQISLY